LEADAVDLEHALVLLDERILRLGENARERLDVERADRRDDGKAADELGDQPELVQVFRLHLGDQLVVVALARDGRAEADAALAEARSDDLLETREGARDDEQHVRRVELDELLVRVLAP